METIYLSLGSNLGDRLKNMNEAVSQLSGFLSKMNASTLYNAEPVGMAPGTEWFLNAVVEGETDLSPEALLRVCQEIETNLGRTQPKISPLQVESTEPKTYEPRTMDIDILFYGHKVISTPHLTIPHPYVADRKFVLLPMAELSRNFLHPGIKKTIWELLSECKDTSTVEKYYGKQ